MKRNAPVVLCSGRVVQDHIFYAAGETPDGLDSKTDYEEDAIYAGGAAANAAFTAGILTKAAFGVNKVRLYSAFGHASREFHDDLNECGVMMRDCRPSQDYTVRENMVVVYPNGDRHVLRDKRGIASKFNEQNIILPEHMKDQLDEDLEFTDIVLLGTSDPMLSLPIASAARERNIPVMLDAGAWKDFMPDLIGLSDIVIASHEFKPEGQKSSPEEILSYLHHHRVKQAAVTMGKEPVIASVIGQQGVFTVPVPNFGKTMDTLGAGDIMHGAFAFFHAVSGGDFEWSLEQANKVASHSVTARGPREGIRKLRKGDISLRRASESAQALSPAV